MIHWLIQSLTAHPYLADGIPPEALLNTEEQEKFAALSSFKRRQEWLLGRWTAKHLIAQIINTTYQTDVALADLHILNRHTGEPFAAVNGQHLFSLTISHSQGYAFCAMVEKENWPIGADMEHIEPRSATFVADYFTPSEITLLEGTPSHYVDTMITAIWSAKEATLKALHLGLSVDTRSVICLPTTSLESDTGWNTFSLFIDTQRIYRALPPLTGWWRVMGEYVLTLVSQNVFPHDFTLNETTLEKRFSV